MERAETIFSAGRDIPLAEELELRQRFVDGYHYLHQRHPARLARLEGLVRQIQTESLVGPRLNAGTIIRVVLPLLGYIALVVFEDIDEAIGRTRALLHRSRETLAQQRNSIRAEILAIGNEIGQPTTDN